MEKKEKVSLKDWRTIVGILFILIGIIFVIISLIILGVYDFINNYELNDNLGNGFWAINHYGVYDLLFNWHSLEDYAVNNSYQSHPFYQIYVALTLLLFVAPLFLLFGLIFFIRWWITTRI